MELIDQETKRIMEDCKIKARNCGLSFDDETLEFIVTNQDMIELSPKIMIPTLYNYWVQDVQVIQDKGKYSIFPHNPYETVINTRPAISFYVTDNPDWLNIMIFYHVLGHIDFFQNNKYFEKTWNDDFKGKALSDKRRINAIREELGEDKRFVDYVIEFARGIDNLVNFYGTLKTEIKDKSEESDINYFFNKFLKDKEEGSNVFTKEMNEYNNYVDKYGVEDGESYFISNVKAKYPEFSSWYKKYKEKSKVKNYDLLSFLVNESPVVNKEKNKWMKDILNIVRDTSLYFQPQIRTKICNEGWACVVGDTLVHTEDGFVPIRDAQEYCSRVVGINKKLTNIGKIKPPQVYDTIKVKTNRFLNIEGAYDHRVLKVEEGKESDIKLRDLKIGDELVLSCNNDIWPSEMVKIDKYACFQKQALFPDRQNKVDIPEYVDEDLAYLFGSLIAEGCWLGRGFGFKNSDRDYALRIEKIIEDKFGKTPYVQYSDEGKINVVLYSTIVMEYMKQVGMDTVNKSHNKTVPWSILQSPKTVVSSFIAGFTDGDGCVYYDGRNSRSIILTSKSEKLLEEISLLLSNFGIVGLYSINKKSGYDDCYQLRISSGLNIKKYKENIPIRDEKKIKLLNDAVNSIKQPREILYTAKVIDISYGKEINYDWEIPDGNYYVAQGFINHNSLFHDYLFRNDDRICSHESDYSLVNSKVVSNPKIGLNPYAIGLKLLEFIYDMAEKGKLNNYRYQSMLDIDARKDFNLETGKGWETLFNIRRNFNDFMLINFLDENDFQEFVTTNKLFVAGKKLNPERRTWEYYIKSRNGEDYRQMLIDQLYHPPNIEFYVLDSGALHLHHQFEGKVLYRDYIENVLVGLEYLWGDKIILETTEFEKEKDEMDYDMFVKMMMGMEEDKTNYKEVKVLYICKNREVTRQVM